MAEEATEGTEATTPVDYGAMSQGDYQKARAAGPLVREVEEPVSVDPVTEALVEESVATDGTPSPDVEDAESTPTPRLQKRINTLTRQRKEAEATAQTEREARLALEARLLVLEQRGPQQPQEQAASAEAGAPHPDSYDTNDAYMAAAMKFHVQEAIEAERGRVATQAEFAKRQTQVEAAKSRFDSSIEEARVAHTDFDDVVSNTTVTPAPLVSKAIAYNESAGHVGYYLCSHPDEMTRLNGITDGTRLLVELARIEARILPSESSDVEPEPDPLPRTSAPAPVIPPVGDRSGGGAPKDPTSSQEAWQEWRRKGGGRRTG